MKILVSAESFGYGPITTGLNVVKELKKFSNISLDFIGSGIALEQAKLSNCFENYYLCDTNDFKDLKKYDLNKLDGICEEFDELLHKYQHITKMTDRRINKICTLLFSRINKLKKKIETK